MPKKYKRITREMKEQTPHPYPLPSGERNKVRGNGEISCPAGGIGIDLATCMVRQVRYPEGCLAVVCEQYGGE